MKNRPLTNQPVHLIYRLHDSLPSILLSRLKESYKAALEELNCQYTPKDLQDEHTYQLYRNQRHDLEEQFQEAYDQTLDRVVEGPRFLADSAIQQIIINSWRKMEEMGWGEVYAVSVMPNHVHVLACHPELKGITPLETLMEKHKHFTGRLINAHLGRSGKRVWAKQVFDRDVRPGRLGTIFWYILNNPVKAGLCKDGLKWPGNYWRPDWV